jgi:hypothetical protein
LAEGSAPVAGTLRSTPGRAFWLSEGEPPPNQPQPDNSARADTPNRPSHSRPLPIRSRCRRIVVTRW